eukprot:2227034-Amphidinium_carterae.1
MIIVMIEDSGLLRGEEGGQALPTPLLGQPVASDRNKQTEAEPCRQGPGLRPYHAKKWSP